MKMSRAQFLQIPSAKRDKPAANDGIRSTRSSVFSSRSPSGRGSRNEGERESRRTFFPMLSSWTLVKANRRTNSFIEAKIFSIQRPT